MSKTGNVLNVTYRETKGKGEARRMRRSGKIPAIVYGGGKDTRQLTLDTHEWKALFASQVKMLKLKDDKGKVTNVLIKDYQYDYLSDSTLHVDFLEVKMDEIIRSTVVIHSFGSPVVGTSQGGILEQPIHELEVSCLPADLPESLEVDVSKLELEESILVKDLPLPPGVTAEADAEQTVFHVITPSVEEEPEEAEEEEGVEGEEGAEAAEGDSGSGEEDSEKSKE